MKKPLGSWLLSLLFAFSLIAEENTFRLKTFETNAFVNEPIYFEVEFTKRANNAFVKGDFTPIDTKKVEYERIGISEEIVGHNQVTTFEYLLFAKTAGKINLQLQGVAGHLTEDELRSSSNYADAAGVTKAHEVIKKLKVFKLNIAPKNQALTVGDFKLTLRKYEESIFQNEPLHIEVTIEGYARAKSLIPELVLSEYVQKFSQNPSYKEWIKEGKLYSKASYTYALVSDKPYTLDIKPIAYFNVKSRDPQSLSIDKQEITLKDAKEINMTLLDSTEAQKLDNSEVGYWLTILSYFALFVVGYISAKLDVFAYIKLPNRAKKLHFKDEKALKQYLASTIDNPINEHYLRALELEVMSFKEVTKKL
jgi:hypothetical protein